MGNGDSKNIPLKTPRRGDERRKGPIIYDGARKRGGKKEQDTGGTAPLTRRKGDGPILERKGKKNGKSIWIFM